MKNRNHKYGNIKTKYLNNMRKKKSLKVKNSLLELEKDLIEFKDRESKDREIKIKRAIEVLFFKPIIASTDDMENFEEKEMKKVPPFKNNWYVWLVNCISEPVRKSLGCIIDEFISLFKTNSPKKTVYGRGKKLNKSEKTIINRFRNRFILKKEKKRIKYRTFSDIRAIFDQYR